MKLVIQGSNNVERDQGKVRYDVVDASFEDIIKELLEAKSLPARRARGSLSVEEIAEEISDNYAGENNFDLPSMRVGSSQRDLALETKGKWKKDDEGNDFYDCKKLTIKNKDYKEATYNGGKSSLRDENTIYELMDKLLEKGILKPHERKSLPFRAKEAASSVASHVEHTASSAGHAASNVTSSTKDRLVRFTRVVGSGIRRLPSRLRRKGSSAAPEASKENKSPFASKLRWATRLALPLSLSILAGVALRAGRFAQLSGTFLARLAMLSTSVPTLLAVSAATFVGAFALQTAAVFAIDLRLRFKKRNYEEYEQKSDSEIKGLAAPLQNAFLRGAKSATLFGYILSCCNPRDQWAFLTHPKASDAGQVAQSTNPELVSRVKNR